MLTPDPSKVGRVTATTNELDALVQDLVDSSKKVRTNPNADNLTDIMNDLADTARQSVNMGTQPPLNNNINSVNNKPNTISLTVNNDLDGIMDGLNKFIPSGSTQTSDPNVDPGCCSSCRKPITGDIVQALNKQYHPEHFLCTSCGTLLGAGNFYEQEGQPQCEQCFYSHYCMQCASCGLPITTQVINALNSNWHPSCFVCSNCLGPFADGSFFDRDGKPYCSNCFNSVYAPRCKSCGQSIAGACVNAMGTQFHPEHFVCQFCKRPFPGGLFFEINGEPYCEAHYQLHQQKIARGLSLKS